MQPLDPMIHECRALIVDGNATSRSTLIGMVRDFGVGTVVQTSRPVDARRILENRTFDIVLCEQHFEGEAQGGQELLDDLRRAQLLPFATVFVMVTGEASYAKVAEAAESALDSYLLKPHNAQMLGTRLVQARHRKVVLGDIFTAIEENRFEDAASLCLERFARRGEYWLYAARMGAELMLRIGKHDAARQLYEAVRATRALPWAKLGIARAEVESGALLQARRTLESLIADNPAYADAYDVMGRVQVENGDITGALETYRRACEITPSSVSRLQKQGMLAFYGGNFEEAERCFDRATSIGISSKMFDPQTLVLLSMVKFDRGDSRGVVRCHENLGHFVEKQPDNQRLQRFLRIVTILRTMQERQVAKVVQMIKDAVAEHIEPSFDFEAASNLMALLTRIARTEIQLPDAEIWVEQLALRFCISKASTDLLAAAAHGSAGSDRIIRETHTKVLGMAEQALTHSVKGSPSVAVATLIKQGEKTLNAKLIELSLMVLNRHRDRIDLFEPMQAGASALRDRYCAQGTRLNLNEGGRSAGGMALRA